MILETHNIHLAKTASRSLVASGDHNLRKQLDIAVAGASTAQRRAKGWIVEIDETYSGSRFWREEVIPEKNIQTSLLYHASIRVTLDAPESRLSSPLEFHNIVNTLVAKAIPQKWNLADVDGQVWDVKAIKTSSDNADGAVRINTAEAVGYAPFMMPDAETWTGYFTELYGLDDQIARIRGALIDAQDTGFDHRFNCVLVGPPGCGKSHVCRMVKAALGEDSVMEFDGPSTTQAGAQKELSEERDELPRVLVVEEIEKAEGNSLQWLLSMTDLRGEIRKVTARKNILRDTKMLCIATVNDYPTFKKISFGALESRFANKIFFQRPSRELLTRILQREIDKYGGNEDWIKPTLDFAEDINTTDPREILSICFCGRDSLLTGEYQKQMMATGFPTQESDADESNASAMVAARRKVEKRLQELEATVA